VDLTSKDIFLLLAGFMLSVVGSGVWHWWLSRSQRSRSEARLREERWRERVNHIGYMPRAEAASEIVIRSLYWLVLGNVMFGVSGLAWVLDLTGVFGVQSVFASATSFGAVIFLAISLRWLRLFLRLRAAKPEHELLPPEQE
jgi:hypothetical protein